MTRPSVRDSPPPLVREASSSSVSSSSSLLVPSGAVVHNLTPVASASRLLECSQIIRQNQFLHLVRQSVLRFFLVDCSRHLLTAPASFPRSCMAALTPTAPLPRVCLAANALSRSLSEPPHSSPPAPWLTTLRARIAHISLYAHTP